MQFSGIFCKYNIYGKTTKQFSKIQKNRNILKIIPNPENTDKNIVRQFQAPAVSSSEL